MTTDTVGTSPAGTGGSLGGHPLDPKALAEKMDVAPSWCPHLSKDETALIIAALRAYEPPCQHEWDKRDDGREWWWSGEFKIWLHRCLRCGVAEVARDLVPGEAAP